MALLKCDRRTLWTLFASTFRLSACTFGGGFVIIPLMRGVFVQKLGWLEEEEMLDMTAIAQSSPGPIAVNAAILVGFRVAGLRGALLCALGTTLPPLIILSIISLFYEAFRDNAIVSMVMAGMLAGVAAVLADVVVTLARNLFKTRRVLPVVLMVLAFVAVYVCNVNILLVLLCCGLAGAADTYVRVRREGKEPKA